MGEDHSLIGSDLPLDLRPAATGAPLVFTPDGAETIPRHPDGSDAKVSDPAKTLYQPWPFYGAPLWGKLK